MNLIDLFLTYLEHHKVFSFIGMAKNVGKTTTFNYLIDQCKSNYILGLTSIGRDGEKTDILTNQPKPKILVRKGYVLATAEESLNRSNFKKNILAVTNISSALGKIFVVKVLGKGYVELSGPSLITYLYKVCSMLKDYGAQIIFIDGAFDRKSFASPLIAQATILATGAAVSNDMEEVISSTKTAVEKLSTPILEDTKAIHLIKEFFKSHKAGLMDKNYNIFEFDVRTALNATDAIIDHLTSATKYILIKGIVGTNLIQKLMKKRNFDYTKISVIAEDGTKLFISSEVYNRFLKSQGKIQVIQPIQIIAVTANPVSPFGIKFDQKKFLLRLRDVLKIPVFDVVSGG